MDDEPPKKVIKRRRPRFSEPELRAMISEIEKRSAVILGNRKLGISEESKQRDWQEVCTAVNAVARVPRTMYELRRKLKDMKSHLKSKVESTPAGVITTFSDVELALFKLQSPIASTGVSNPDSKNMISKELLSSPSTAGGEHLSSTRDNAIIVVGSEEMIIPINPYPDTTRTPLPAAMETQSLTTSQAPSAAPPKTPSTASSQILSTTISHLPSLPTSHVSNRSESGPTTPTADHGDDFRLTTQQEIRDLLKALVEAMKNNIATQNDTAAAQRDIAATLRDTAAAQKDSIVVQKDTAAALRDTAAAQNDTAAALRDTAAAQNDTAAALRDTAAAQKDTATALNETVAIVREGIAVMQDLTRFHRKNAQPISSLNQQQNQKPESAVEQESHS